jgi:hypothetical protein
MHIVQRMVELQWLKYCATHGRRNENARTSQNAVGNDDGKNGCIHRDANRIGVVDSAFSFVESPSESPRNP